MDAQVVKIGEGAFGEAFKFENVVMKIIPFEGTMLVYGYPQMDAEHMLPEVLMCKLLSDLSTSPEHLLKFLALPIEDCHEYTENSSSGFAAMHDTKICHGPYPEQLIHEWERLILLVR